MNGLLGLVELDSKDLIGILVWSNFALSLLVFGYRFTRNELNEKNMITLYAHSRLYQGIAWLLLFLRGDIPIFVSRDIGNVILFTGFYLEALVMLIMVKYLNKLSLRIESLILIISSIGFILISADAKDQIFVIASSVIIFSIFIFPTVLYMFSKSSSRFKRYIGLLYVIFCSVMVLRGIDAHFENMSLFTVNYIQNFSYITLVLLVVVSGPGFLLLAKEESDKALVELATHDVLTRIPNRRYFMDRAVGLLENHRRHKHVLSMLFIDIDYFKKVNDTYGHQFGDKVLIHLGNALTTTMRMNDLYCRYGGEEFIVVLSETKVDGAEAYIQRLTEEIKKTSLLKERFEYTISIGLVSLIPEKHSLEEVIKKSDEAMYQAKMNGRNQHFIYKE
ncbi:MAG: GGDEF domain-containing protein [Clostridiales bacterium]|nr:GGDEF domain-containing protein [Clostridiales bacterium]